MAGQTPNQNILNAIDEVIHALNDLAIQVSPPSLTTIEEGVDRVGDKLEQLNTTHETRSIAEVTAQNTNFTDLISAINGLSLTCAPEINTTCPAPVINVSCGGCGGSGGTNGGTKLEDPPVSETDPPPPGGEPDPNIDNRKCKAANLIYDQIYYSLSELNKHDPDFYLNAGVTGTASIVGAIIGWSIGGPLGAVVGAIVGIAASLVAGVDLDDVILAMDTGHEDLVCVLFSSADTEQAKNDFLAILENEGVNTVEELGFVTYFLVSDYLRVLFQAVGDSEAILDGYVSAIDCSACNPGFIINGQWGILTNDNGLHTAQSEQDGSIHRLNIIYNAPSPAGGEIYQYQSTQTFGTYFNLAEDSVLGGIWLPRNENNQPTTQPFSQTDLNDLCIRTLSLAASAPFEISFLVRTCQ